MASTPRKLRGAAALWDTIRQVIEDADALAVWVSPDGLQSKWLGRKFPHPLNLQRPRGKDHFAVIPWTLDDTRLGVLAGYFDEAPTCTAAAAAAAPLLQLQTPPIRVMLVSARPEQGPGFSPRDQAGKNPSIDKYRSPVS